MPPALPLVDRFDRDALRGRVVGTRATSGHDRFVIDAERIISIDHDALRIPPLRTTGFGRAGISYGPFAAEPGLTLAVSIVNGHNSSQGYAIKSLLRQVGRWTRGGNASTPLQQLAGWIRHWPRESLARRIACWSAAHDARLPTPYAHVPPDINLAIGLFSTSDSPDAAAPPPPTHSRWLKGERNDREPAPQPLPRHAFFVKAGGHRCGRVHTTNAGAFTEAFDSFQNIHATYVVVLGTTHAAYFLAGPSGAHGTGAFPAMKLIAIEPRTTAREFFASIHQAVLGEIGFHADTRVFSVGVDRVPELASVVDSLAATSPRASKASDITLPRSLAPIRPWSPPARDVLVRDDFGVAEPPAIGKGQGVVSPAPEPPAPMDPAGASSSTTPLDARTILNSALRWERTFGQGRIDLSPKGAGARATNTSPNPGRTLYTISWPNPTFADLRVRMTPPGTARYQKHDGRGGIVFWQDERRYLIVNLWLHDGYDGASISSFPIVDGFDDIYNAVWTNIGSRATWGEAFNLRVACDGDNYLAFVNDEPVLSRRLSDIYPAYAPMRINRVGLALNWEWGNDTGTVFHSFEAR